MIDKEIIQNYLRIYGPGDPETIPIAKAFYVDINNHPRNFNIWGTYEKTPRMNIEDRKQLLEKRKLLLHFPIEPPIKWLKEEIQNSKFAIMIEGATTPLGYYSELILTDNLEKAIEKIESLKLQLKPIMQYGIYALYLGKRLDKSYYANKQKKKC